MSEQMQDQSQPQPRYQTFQELYKEAPTNLTKADLQVAAAYFQSGPARQAILMMFVDAVDKKLLLTFKPEEREKNLTIDIYQRGRMDLAFELLNLVTSLSQNPPMVVPTDLGVN